MRTFLGIALALSFAGTALAQPAARGAASDISNADIQAALKATASMPVNDQQLRVVAINGEYNVGVAVVHRSKASASAAGGAAEHSQVAEVYQIVSGNGTLVTGGTLANAKEPAPNPLAGPTANGSGVLNGQSRKVGPGDVVIIPPNTPHIFSEIASDEIVYLVVRVDPHKVLPIK